VVAASSFLSGISVLDCSIWRPGPYATSLLVPLGADVLKVEPPGGDPMRQYAGLFASVNAGKRSIVLDLKSAEGRRRALELAAAADVVVEGFRPGVMARLGLDEPRVREVNPDVVYCSISGYGQQGDRALLPGHDVNYQAWAGSLSPEGQAAVMPPLPVADLASGMAAAFGICAALLGRGRAGGGGDGVGVGVGVGIGIGGEGAYLDVAMTDVVSTWTGDTGADDGGAVTTRTGGPAVPGYGLFTTADGGQVALGVVSEDHFWSALCNQLELADVAGLDFIARSRRGVELNDLVARSVARCERGTLVAALLSAGVPVAPVLDRRTMVAGAPFPRFPIRFGAAPHAPLPKVPALDQHHGEGFR
jgi:alpha-methylacyl-CoA racemase